MSVRRWLVVVAWCLYSLSARGQAPATQSETVVGGPDGLALMQTLNRELLGSRSATRTLEQWCGDHHLAAEPRITAHLIRALKLPSPEQLQRLDVPTAADVRYRRVQLECGTRVLSEADNWYVPARLTKEMNTALETTDMPFGTAVRPLDPSRETLGVTMFWSGETPVPDALFAHRAMLYTGDHVPFAEVYEVYQKALLSR